MSRSLKKLDKDEIVRVKVNRYGIPYIEGQEQEGYPYKSTTPQQNREELLNSSIFTKYKKSIVTFFLRSYRFRLICRNFRGRISHL